MTFEWGLRLVVAAVAMAGAIGTWRSSRSRYVVERLGVQFVGRNLAIVEERFVPLVNGHFRREMEARAGCLVVIATLVLVLPGELATSIVGLYSVGAAATGVFCAALALSAAREAGRPFDLGETASRTARLRTVRVGDFIPPWVRVATLVVVGALVAGVLGTFPQARPRDLTVVTLIGIATLLGGLVATELAARHVTAAPEPAADAAHLYWQDALRADSMATGYFQVLTGAALMWSGWSISMLEWNRGAGFWQDLAVPVGMAPLAVAGAVQLAWYIGTPWFRRQLWPELAKGQVIVPGRQVVA